MLTDREKRFIGKIGLGVIAGLVILFSIPAFATGSAKVGGTFINSDETTFAISLDDQKEFDLAQYVAEVDYILKEVDGVKTLDEFYGSIKFNHTFDSLPKHYVFTQTIYDQDKLRANQVRTVMAYGYGYKLLRTERFKSSNEFSVGYLKSDLTDELIYRNSLWFFFKLTDKVDFTNKYLLEWGDASEDYVRNETALNYNFDNGMILSLNNTYTEDPVDNNVLNVTIGYKW